MSGRRGARRAGKKHLSDTLLYTPNQGIYFWV